MAKEKSPDMPKKTKTPAGRDGSALEPTRFQRLCWRSSPGNEPEWTTGSSERPRNSLSPLEASPAPCRSARIAAKKTIVPAAAKMPPPPHRKTRKGAFVAAVPPSKPNGSGPKSQAKRAQTDETLAGASRLRQPRKRRKAA